MAQLRPRDTLISRIRPLSADFAPRTKEDSMLYSMLPAVVKSRLPRIPSFRRSASMYGLTTRRKPAPSASADSRPSSGSTSGSRTPEYTSAVVLSGSRAMAEADISGYFIESASSDEDRPPALERKERSGQGMELTERKSGIGWKFANQGLSLLSLAVEESSTISRNPNFGNAPFARQLYLHSLTYLLRALPSDLTTEEKLSVRSSLPVGVVEPLHLEVNPGYTPDTHASPTTQPSLLHRTLASTIIQLFILFQFILPYLKYMLSAAYQYDREHKISEKVLSQSIETVDALGKTSIGFTAALYGMGGDKVGQMITDTAVWVVEGVTGGIHEGVGEGMVILGVAPRRGQGGTERK